MAEDAGCGFSITKIPGGRSFELAEAEAFLRDKKIGPLEGFRSKAGWPFSAELRLAYDDEITNWKLEFDFGEDAKREGESGEPVDFGQQPSLGACPKCQGHVYEHGTSYVCEHAVGAHVTCDFKSGKIILQQPVAREQMSQLLATGKTDLLDKFVSMRTRRAFKAFLAWDPEAGKVSFQFEPRTSKYPPRKTAAGAAAKTPAAGKTAAKKATKASAKTAKPVREKKPRAPSAGMTPSPALAAVIGAEAVARTEVIKKLWDYIKAQGLQDAANKRAINADAKLKEVFGKDQVTMFELAGIIGKHLS
jgi:DNA topoisomerase-3